MRSVRGFTLVELLVTLAVLGVIVGMAVPSFSEMLRSNHAQLQSGLLAKTFNYARSEAIKRGSAVRVSALSNGNWHLGWRVWVDRNGNNSFDQGELLTLTPAWDGSEQLTSATTTVTFSSGGALAGVTGGTGAFSYNAGSSYCRFNRDITVNAVGRTSVVVRGCQ